MQHPSQFIQTTLSTINQPYFKYYINKRKSHYHIKIYFKPNSIISQQHLQQLKQLPNTLKVELTQTNSYPYNNLPTLIIHTNINPKHIQL